MAGYPASGSVGTVNRAERDQVVHLAGDDVIYAFYFFGARKHRGGIFIDDEVVAARDIGERQREHYVDIVFGDLARLRPARRVHGIFDALLEELDYREKSRGSDNQRYEYLDEAHGAAAARCIYFYSKDFKRLHYFSSMRRGTRGGTLSEFLLKLSLLYIILPNFQIKLKRNEKMSVFLSAGLIRGTL